MTQSMIEVLLGSLARSGGDAKLGGRLGANQASVDKAVAVVLPILVSALAKNASSGRGAQSLHKALAKDHDGSLLDGLASYLGAGENTVGDAILGHVFGEKRDGLERAIADRTGLEAELVHQAMTMLAPVVLAYLGRSLRSRNMTKDDLSSMLKQEQQSARSSVEAAFPGLGQSSSQAGQPAATDAYVRMGMDLLGSLLAARR